MERIEFINILSGTYRVH